jgi:hypothetical protein
LAYNGKAHRKFPKLQFLLWFSHLAIQHFL